ncbi:hypothetical protein E2C01_098530 [Portunus trituberculatus]|uniref:Uncharacterized protein n=1 Tax=Portunus trituberculatus TaxID=210409 RepID=A0A5B7K1F6_PORTR|nr:hypothetical protein [Portunus trituberculatus]
MTDLLHRKCKGNHNQRGDSTLTPASMTRNSCPGRCEKVASRECGVGGASAPHHLQAHANYPALTSSSWRYGSCLRVGEGEGAGLGGGDGEG